MKKYPFCIIRKARFIFIMLLFVLAQNGWALSHTFDQDEIGTIAYQHIVYLSEEVGARPTGTDGEAKAQHYIIDAFEDLDYDVSTQSFSFTHSKETYSSLNIIATKKGASDRTLIVGAHYDTVKEKKCNDPEMVLTGAGDNGSGIGVLLEVAELLSEVETDFSIKFVAFGAEEMGLHGSIHYAKAMLPREIEKTIGMINLDSVGVGDFFYVYSGKEDNPTGLRDFALRIGKELPYELRTSPESEYFRYGTTGDWSDHVPFRLLGIPIAYFEWVNWDIHLDGGIETAEYGWIMHTCRDNLSFVKFDKIKATTHLITQVIADLPIPERAFFKKDQMVEAEIPKIIQHRYVHE